MNIVRITTLLLLLSIRMYGWANNYSSMHIDSDNGLTQSNVKSITQDKYGFIWLGTKNGLNRYDGHQLLQFIVRDNEQHCSNQNVSALYSDRQGTLWVGTDEGLYYYDDAKDRFHRIITKAQDGTILNSWIANITEDNRGRIWAVAGDQGVYCYHSGTLKRYLYHFKKHEMPCNIIVCSDGSVW
ncbi:MAG: two-component regulator propeller domain-containing protein, partial [Prevotella sp.]|nr:two-component regulator propeller domain-containing protein [Prevotella sp.]